MTSSPLRSVVSPVRSRSSLRRSHWPYISLIPWFGVWAPIDAWVKACQRTWICGGRGRRGDRALFADLSGGRRR
jgi:hypothetical protein